MEIVVLIVLSTLMLVAMLIEHRRHSVAMSRTTRVVACRRTAERQRHPGQTASDL